MKELSLINPRVKVFFTVFMVEGSIILLEGVVEWGRGGGVCVSEWKSVLPWSYLSSRRVFFGRVLKQTTEFSSPRV